MTASDTSACCEFLAWDSEFFDLRIGRVSRVRLTEDDVPAIEEWTRTEDIDCLYYLADPQHSESIRLAEHMGFRLTDTRVTLVRQLPSPAEGPLETSITVRSHRPEDVQALCRIASASHGDSRYYQDGGFDRERCDALFATWIRNSCAGFADEVLVVTCEEEPAGYLSCHLDPDGSGRIGLTAVGETFRGRSLGTRLIRASIDWFTAQGCDRSVVFTQARNTAACRFYEANGFLRESLRPWYHLWPKKREARRLS